MAIVYFDASAYVKLLVEEDGSDLAARLWDGCDAAVSSRLAYPEVRAALAAARRNRQMSTRAFASSEESWDQFWSATRAVELTDAVARHAGSLAGSHGLRGADAVHLASALVINDPEIVVAVWDSRLRDAVVAARLSVAPAE